MRRSPAAACLVCLIAFVAVARAGDPPPGPVTTTPLVPGLAMLSGAGGNVTVAYGADGVVLVDAEYASMADTLRQAIAALSPLPPRFLIDTHWHPDHTGGNAAFAAQGAIVIAQDTVRRRLSTDQTIAFLGLHVRAAPSSALPVLTFTQNLSLHLDGDDIDVIHVPPAHTDGDSIVVFRKADVIATGDLFFNRGYPFIDLSSGGSVNGLIAAVEQVLSLADEHTLIVPGHGPLAHREDLRAYRDLLVTVRDRVNDAIHDGKTLAQTQALKPTAGYDAVWGHGFLPPDRFVALLYAGLSGSDGN